jgi:hypothetical protein
MKKLLTIIACLAALAVQADETNTFVPNEIILVTIPHANLQGQTVRITPNGWSLFGSVTARVEVRNPNGLLVTAENVTIAGTAFNTWTAISRTNKALATKTLAIYLAKQVSLTNNPAVPDQVVTE